jgi:hypothetical protein
MVAEANEADTIGLVKVAEQLTRQVEKSAVRATHEGYTYSGEDFENDVQEAIWGAVIRTADFHNAYVDSKRAQKIVEHYAEQIVSDIRKAARLGQNGAYEPLLPGESRRTELLSIDEE